MKFNVLMLSYRGYGLSEGSPTEKGLKIDAQTALDFITNHPDLGQTPIVRLSSYCPFDLEGPKLITSFVLRSSTVNPSEEPSLSTSLLTTRTS